MQITIDGDLINQEVKKEENIRILCQVINRTISDTMVIPITTEEESFQINVKETKSLKEVNVRNQPTIQAILYKKNHR
jgi:regulation of enolase protein 1 (concanavalin A-like superfamily)